MQQRAHVVDTAPVCSSGIAANGAVPNADVERKVDGKTIGKMPPPLSTDELPLMVLLATVSWVPTKWIPPWVEFPLMVLSVIVACALLCPKPKTRSAELPLTVVLTIVAPVIPSVTPPAELPLTVVLTIVANAFPPIALLKIPPPPLSLTSLLTTVRLAVPTKLLPALEIPSALLLLTTLSVIVMQAQPLPPLNWNENSFKAPIWSCC
ncbi:MAG TPA: hypothetical protein VGY75_08660 [Candidatus Udaeobacter sp.]|nr:hypothetical protein [Candidatus Udaeobacter sp.]